MFVLISFYLLCYNHLDILEVSGDVHYDWKHRKGDC